MTVKEDDFLNREEWKVEPSSGGSSLRKWVWRALVGMGVAVTATAVVGAVAFHRVERAADHVAEIGTSLKIFTGLFATTIQEHNVEGLLALHDDRYASKEEGIWQEELVSDRDGVQVYSWKQSDVRDRTKDELREQYDQFLEGVGTIEECKVKVNAIEKFTGDDSAIVRIVLWLRGHSKDGKTRESHATFRMNLARKNDDWVLLSKTLLHGNTVEGTGRGFTNVTESAGIAFEASRNPKFEQPEWYPAMYEIFKYSSGGVATADYDNDGWYDLFFCDGKSPCLYRNMGDGTFEDVTSTAGLPVGLEGVQVAIFADFDNDGDRDLFLGRTTGENLLFENLGMGAFQDVSASAGVSGFWVTTAAAGDYDNDGLVDLYLGRYLDPRTQLPTTNFYSRNGIGNTLLKNCGELNFSDVTSEAGVREGGLALALAWGDYDTDGDQDIFVANDFGRNALFRNNGDGTFEDVAKEVGTVSVGYGMSASMEDIDSDGDLDIYVAGVHSSQRWFGNEATIKQYVVNSIKAGTFLSERPLYRDMRSKMDFSSRRFGSQIIGGNTLLLNNGNGSFADVTEESNANPHGWFWGAAVFDFDNDGCQDIYASNGWITGKKLDDL